MSRAEEEERAARAAFPEPQRPHPTLAPLYVEEVDRNSMRRIWAAFPVYPVHPLVKTEAPELPPMPKRKAKVEPPMEVDEDASLMEVEDDEEEKVKPEVKPKVKPEQGLGEKMRPKRRLQLLRVVYSNRDRSPYVIHQQIQQKQGVEYDAAVERVERWIKERKKQPREKKRAALVTRLLALAYTDFDLAWQMKRAVDLLPGIGHATLIRTPRRMEEAAQRATYDGIKGVLRTFRDQTGLKLGLLQGLMQALFEVDPVTRTLNDAKVTSLCQMIVHQLSVDLEVPRDHPGRIKLASDLLLLNHVLFADFRAPIILVYLRRILRALDTRVRDFLRDQRRRREEASARQNPPRARRTKRRPGAAKSPFVAPVREQKERVTVDTITGPAWFDRLQAERDLLIDVYDAFASSGKQDRNILREQLQPFSTWSFMSLQTTKGLDKSVSLSMLNSSARNRWKMRVHPDRATRFDQPPFNEDVNVTVFREFLDVLTQVLNTRMEGPNIAEWTPEHELELMLAHT